MDSQYLMQFSFSPLAILHERGRNITYLKCVIRFMKYLWEVIEFCTAFDVTCLKLVKKGPNSQIYNNLGMKAENIHID